MRKTLALVLALMLCMSATAMAEFVPSKTTGSMTNFTATAENLPEGASFTLGTLLLEGELTPEQEKLLASCESQLAALSKSESVAAYFGAVVNANGEPVSLSDLLGTSELKVYEFCPIVADSFDLSYGNVTAQLLFSTPYEAGEEVAVLVGIIAEDETVAWTAFDGVVKEAVEQDDASYGCIEVVFTPEIIAAIQENPAILAVVSK